MICDDGLLIEEVLRRMPAITGKSAEYGSPVDLVSGGQDAIFNTVQRVKIDAKAPSSEG
jgi:hypothetical protein